MSRFGARRQAPVGVGQAEAFVSAMKAIAEYAELRDGWAGPDSLRVRVPAVNAARRLFEARQTMATRLTPMPMADGGIGVSFLRGADASGDVAHVHIDKHGCPAIREGGPSPETGDVQRYTSVSDKKFRKALDDIISPRTGRIAAKRIEIDGIVFDSEIEGRRYLILKGEVGNGRVTDLEMQVPYVFVENGAHCFTYYADFRFRENGVEIVEDVKGMRTDVYRIKKKLVEARYGITISEWPITRKEMARRAAAAARADLQRQKSEKRIERARLAAERADERERLAAERAARTEARRAATGRKAA